MQTPRHTPIGNARLTRRQFTLTLAAAGAAVTSGPAIGQAAWPSKPIRVIVPYTPGGFTDQMARLVQPGLQNALGQTVVVDNKPGANSILGSDLLAKSAPDGTTFGVVIAAYSANTTLYPKLPYNPAKDLTGVALIGVAPLVAAVNNDTPFKNARDVIAYARANPGKISFGSSGSGSAAHLTTELWKQLTGTYMVHIPYRGTAPALTDLMGGQIQLLFDAGAGLASPGKAGRVRMIGTAGDKRLPVLPDLPTFVEQGFKDFIGSTWAGMLAPAGTPREIVQRMNEEINKILLTSDAKARLDATGTFAGGGTPEDFNRFIDGETAKWAKVIRSAGVTVEG
jgi:tripartite-type tricarboxylate transporter receptor subunit TctC